MSDGGASVDQGSCDDLDLDGCRRLAAAVLRSGLSACPAVRERFAASVDFDWWCRAYGADPEVIRREWRRYLAHGAQ